MISPFQFRGEHPLVIILKGSDQTKAPDYFDRMFCLRHQVFVTQRGWSLPTRNGREIDQYDVDGTIYFIDINDDDVIEGSVRLTPTEEHSLLADYFPHLVESSDTLRSPHIFEATRFIVLPVRKNRDSIRISKARLVGALIEWSLKNELSYIQSVIESTMLSRFLEMSLQTIPLGLSHPYGGGRSAPGGGECMAIRWPVTNQVLADIREFGSLSGNGIAPSAPYDTPKYSPSSNSDLRH